MHTMSCIIYIPAKPTRFASVEMVKLQTMAHAKPQPRTKQTMNNKDTEAEHHAPAPDPIAMTRALLDAYEKAQPILQEYMQEYAHEFTEMPLDPLNVREAWLEYMERVAENPQKFWEDQMHFWTSWGDLAQQSMLRFLGETQDAKPVIEPEKGDRRFRAPEWQESAVFDFIKQSYLLTCEWIEKSVRNAEGLDDETKEKLSFSSKLFTGALSPSNFILTNPEVIRETIDTGGDNLIRGLENLIEDLKRGKGQLRISTTDYNAFKLGKNIATTPGKIVYQNDLMQLIQYEPTTKDVHKRPLLIIPPWINKYYILDLRAENSLIKWVTDQGYTTFVISWVNPDRKLAKKRFEDYMQEGLIEAMDRIKDITGEPDCNAVGYCLGGTLLTTTLAYLHKKKQEDRIASATFLTTLIDFHRAGEMKLFMDDAQLELMQDYMEEHGVFPGQQLQQTFSLLRANDLIWSFVVNNYLMGKEPFPFDLLYWNDDPTNMPAAMHSFYLRNMYRDNLLAQKDGITFGDVPIDVGAIETPCYFLSTREDHIAPWKATYDGAKLVGSKKKTFTLAASGHIAGVINPPDKNKYCFWSYSSFPEHADEWMEQAKSKDGSWWPHWEKWLAKQSGDMVKARKPKNAIEDAPGSYVKQKAV